MGIKNKYEKQALEILKEIGAKIELIRLGNAFPEWDEDHLRPLYQFTISNARGMYKGNFYGSCAEYDAEQKAANAYKWGGSEGANARKRLSDVKTGVYDVLACLTKYDPGTFVNFCSDFGYSSDSIKALKTYTAVCEEYHGLARIFTRDELDKLAEIV